MKKYTRLAMILLAFMIIFAVPVFTAGVKESTEEVTVEIYHFKVPWIDAWETMSQEYEAAHPGVTLETEIVGGASDWRTLLKTKFAAGKAPDIFVIEGYSDYQLWKDYIAPLDGESWTTHLLPIAKNAATIDGKIVGIPLAIEGYGYIYNKELFKKAGITNLPTTLSEMKAVVAKLKNHGITPFASGFGTWWVISNHFTNIPFAQQDDPMAYIKALNDTTARIPGNAAFVNWKNAFDLVLNNCEPNPLTTDHNTQVTLFATQQVAMMQQGNWKEAVIYDTDPNLNIGLLPIFTSDNAAQANRIPVGIPFFLCVNNQSSPAEQQAAKDFLAWFVGTPEGSKYLTEDFGAIPAFDNITATSLNGVGTDILAYAKEGKTIPWMFSYWPDGAVTEFADLGQQYAKGIVSFDTYLNNLQTTWQRLKK